MRRRIVRSGLFGLAVVFAVLAFSGGVVAKTPSKSKAKAVAKVKPGAVCPGVALTKNAAKSPVVKAKTGVVATSAKALPRLVDLGSTTCTPCKMMTPILEDLTKDYKGKLTVEFIDVNKDREAPRKYKLQAIPTQVFFDAKGKEIYRHRGYMPKEDILKKFAELGIKLVKQAPAK